MVKYILIIHRKNGCDNNKGFIIMYDFLHYWWIYADIEILLNSKESRQYTVNGSSVYYETWLCLTQ